MGQRPPARLYECLHCGQNVSVGFSGSQEVCGNCRKPCETAAQVAANNRQTLARIEQLLLKQSNHKTKDHAKIQRARIRGLTR